MTSRARHILAALRRRLGAEHGGFLIEVVVSAALIVTAGAGVLVAMNSATDQTAQQRQQAAAANIAQNQLETLRSQKFSFLTANVGTDFTVNPAPTVGGTTYDVKWRADWAMQAQPGAVGCTSNARNPEALRITSTVTWPRMRRAPVVFSSLVAAPAGSAAQRGAYLVQITDRNGAGLSGIPVTMRGNGGGTSTVSGSTDAFGCVRFGELVPGNYDVESAPTGYITPDGASSVDDPASVVAGQTRNSSYEIDRPGSAVIAFKFDNNTGSGTNLVNATPPKVVTIANSGLSSPILKNVTGGVGSTLSTGQLYPFSGSYAAYADGCTSAQPPGPLSFTITPSTALGVPTPLNLQMPALDLQPNGATSGDQLYVKTACANVYGPYAVTNVGGTFKVLDGFPYGTGLEVCAVRPGGTRRWDRVTNVSNTNFTTPTVVNNSNGLSLSSGTSTATPACGGWLP